MSKQSQFEYNPDKQVVIRYRNGEFLESAKRTPYLTMRWDFKWTKSLRKARVFTWAELTGKGPEALSAKEQDRGLLMNLTCGYGGSVEIVGLAEAKKGPNE